MKKKSTLTLTLAFLVFLFCVIPASSIAANYYSVPAQNPVITNSIKPAIAKYKQQNYVGAMQDLEAILEKEPHNMTGIYYLALSYTQLGYKDKAKQLYQILANSNKNEALAYYSQYALDCLENPNSDQCTAQKTHEETLAKNSEVDDITKFIQSGAKIHPSAMDKITNERMIRKIQEIDYQKKQEENKPKTNLKSQNSNPTNEEIIQALNTLKKIGYNPFENDYSFLMSDNLNANYFAQYPMLNNSQYSKMMMLSQMNQFNDLFNNYGI